MVHFTNAVNLRLVAGGEQVKQGDTASLFVYELLDHRMKPIKLDGQEAVLRLVGRKGGLWFKKIEVSESKVRFEISDVLPLDTYLVEVEAGGYVFPSDRRTKIKVVKSEVDYATADVVSLQKLDIAEEIKRQLSDLQIAGISEDRLAELVKKYLSDKHQPSSNYDDSALRAQIGQILGQIATLSGKVDKDTIYDDSGLRTALRALESTVENLKNQPAVDTSNLATKAELEEVRFSQPIVNNLATKAELESYAKKSDLPKIDLSGYATKEDLNQVKQNQPALDTSNLASKHDLATVKAETLQEVKKADYLTGTAEYNIFQRKIEQLETELAQLRKNTSANPPQERRAPTGYYLDRSVEPWQYRFDNGSSLTLGARTDTRAYIHNDSQPLTVESYSEYHVITTLMRTLEGSNKVEGFSDKNSLARFWEGATVTNPVNSAEGLDFSKALYNPQDTIARSKRAQGVLIRCYYELGAFTKEDIKSFGVTGF